MRISDWSSDVCSSDLQLAKNKGEEAVVDYYNAIQDAVNGGAAIEEVANDRKLTLVETPAILPNGHAPDTPDFALPPELAPMAAQAFQGNHGGCQLAPVVEHQNLHALPDQTTTPTA